MIRIVLHSTSLNKIKFLLTFLFIPIIYFHFYSTAYGDFNAHYWTVEEYIKLDPEEAVKQSTFSTVVQSAPVPLRKTIIQPVKIMVLYPGQQISDYWRRSVTSFQHRLDALNIPYTLSSYFTKAGTEIALQGRIIGQYLSEMPDYFIFTLDAKRHKDIIKRTIASGRTKVILQNITTPLKIYADQQPFLYVGFDHSLGTKILAEEYIKRFPNGANFSILYGTRGYVSSLRGNTMIQELNKQQGFNLLSSYYTNFDRQRAYAATLEILSTSPLPQFIYATSTDIAHGVSDALTVRNKTGTIIVNGWGGGESEIQAIQNGELDFTVMRMNDDNGVAMAEAIKLDLEARKTEIPLIYSGDMKKISQNTKPETIKNLREHAFRYSKNQ